MNHLKLFGDLNESFHDLTEEEATSSIRWLSKKLNKIGPKIDTPGYHPAFVWQLEWLLPNFEISIGEIHSTALRSNKSLGYRLYDDTNRIHLSIDNRKISSLRYIKKIVTFDGPESSKTPSFQKDFDNIKQVSDYVESFGLKFPKKMQIVDLGLTIKEVDDLNSIYSFLHNDDSIYLFRFIMAMQDEEFGSKKLFNNEHVPNDMLERYIIENDCLSLYKIIR